MNAVQYFASVGVLAGIGLDLCPRAVGQAFAPGKIAYNDYDFSSGQAVARLRDQSRWQRRWAGAGGAA